MSQLFRKEALENRSRALYGDVVLTGPLSTWLITALLISVIAGAIAVLTLAHVQTHDGAVSLLEWLQGAHSGIDTGSSTQAPTAIAEPASLGDKT